MKFKSTIGLVCCLMTLQSCWLGGNDVEDPLTVNPPNDFYEPIIMQREEFETTTSFQTAPEPMMNTGKIYVKDNFIFINEKDKGFHIIDNADRSNPEPVAFLRVLGSSDLSIKGSTVYVNNATDLLALDIDTQAGTLEIKKRIANTFPQLRSPFGQTFWNLDENEIIVGWQISEDN
ncbi:MAG: hypothetical protein AAF688_12060 [Bacteroidota bacterium]